MPNITAIRHPYYSSNSESWAKWRTIYEGGTQFISRYLKQFSDREAPDDFAKRKDVSYNPAFAKEAVDEIKNAIFPRLADITRKGGSDSYQKAILGRDGGIDMAGSSMNCFIGKEILPELLPLSRVGVYVDMPEITGNTLASNVGKRPYLYTYCTEDILSWNYNYSTKEVTNILLRDHYEIYDKESGLPKDTGYRYRRLWLNDAGFVVVQYYNGDGDMIEPYDNQANNDSAIVLRIRKIPFHIIDIGTSLLENVDGYQIALLNLASADMVYALHSNFPFYTEQFDARVTSEHLRTAGTPYGGESSDAEESKAPKAKVGSQTGRRYPMGMDRPGFIHPSPEPLRASMDKQEQLKNEIRQLVNLSLSNIKPKMASAESKGYDQEGLESGLAYIGLELENMERKVAEFWAMYESTPVATVIYPEIYTIKSAAEKQAEAKSLAELIPSVPSKTCARAITEKIADLLVGRDVTIEDMDKIRSEIKNSKGITADPWTIQQAVQLGYCDLALAAELHGYPKDATQKAADEHAARLARIAESQTPANQGTGGANPAARGVPDLGGNAKQEKTASQDTTTDPNIKKKVRGPGGN